jgi:hypothetical protein
MKLNISLSSCFVFLFLFLLLEAKFVLAFFPLRFYYQMENFYFQYFKGYELSELRFSLSLFYYFPNTKIPFLILSSSSLPIESLTTIFIFLFSQSNWKRVENIRFCGVKGWKMISFFQKLWAFMLCVVLFFRFSHTYLYHWTIEYTRSTRHKTLSS